MVPALWEYKAKWGKPDVLVIYLVENEMVQSTWLDLLRSMKRDLNMLKASRGSTAIVSD